MQALPAVWKHPQLLPALPTLPIKVWEIKQIEEAGWSLEQHYQSHTSTQHISAAAWDRVTAWRELKGISHQDQGIKGEGKWEGHE